MLIFSIGLLWLEYIFYKTLQFLDSLNFLRICDFRILHKIGFWINHWVPN